MQNAWSPYQFRAVSDFDATHQITANWVVDMPFGRNRYIGHDMNRGLDAIVGGWQVSGLGRWTSGFPFSVGNGFQWPTDWDLSGNGIQTGPIKTGTFYSKDTIGEVNAFSNFSDGAASFREPLPGEAGQRNNLRGPGFFTVDAALSKRWTMPWKEGHNLQLRWEVFNTLNRANFLNPTASFSSANFGRILSARDPRIMQLAAKFYF